jgi:uncharacterized membrane protein
MSAMLLGSPRKAFLKAIRTSAIETAIREAERATTGEIRVAVLPRFRGSIEEMTERTAQRLGMTNTQGRNGVLIVVDPARRRFRIWGDWALHEKVGDSFWRDTAQAVEERFRAGDFTGGLVDGVHAAGVALASHFPADAAGHRAQLSDAVDIR